MAEADAEQRQLPLGAGGHERHRLTRVLRGARARRDEHAVDRERVQLVRTHLVVAPHDDLGAQLAQVLDEVVDEAVVVVDDQDAAGQLPGTVTWLIGRCGSIHGKTTNSNSTDTPKISNSTWLILSASGPGRCRQIHTYIRPSP